MRFFKWTVVLLLAGIVYACGAFSGSNGGDDSSSTPDASSTDAPAAQTGDAGASDAGDASTGVDAGPCITLADNENVTGPLAPADPTLYWVNGSSNSVRIYDTGTIGTLFATPDGGALTGVAVAGASIAWATDDGTTIGGRLHVDTLGNIGAGPSVTGLVPQSFQLFGSSVYGVALDRTQANADLFLYEGATTYFMLRQLVLPIGNAVVTSDGWAWVVANGSLQGLSSAGGSTSEGPGVSAAIGTNGASAFYIDGTQIVKTVGPAISIAASGIDAVAIAADDFAIYYFSTPPSTLYRRDFVTTAITALTDVPNGTDRLVAGSTYIYYVVNGARIVRCAKPN